MLHELKPYSVV